MDKIGKESILGALITHLLVIRRGKASKGALDSLGLALLSSIQMMKDTRRVLGDGLLWIHRILLNDSTLHRDALGTTACRWTHGDK